MCVAAPAGGPGAGAGEGELSDPHGGGGGREQRRQRHRRFGEQTSGKETHTHTLSHTKVCVKHAHIAHTYKEHCENNFKTFLEFLSPLMARSPPSQSLSPSLSGGGLSRLRLLFLGENRLIGR